MTLLLELVGAGLRYPGDPPVEALKPCNLRVDRGEYVAVVGTSGSGKSTLLNVLGLLDRPTEGTYVFDGSDTGRLRDGAITELRSQKIGFIFQSFHLMPQRSAAENVELALLYSGARRRDRSARAADVLSRVGMGHRLHALPWKLSGGERQRVAIARALAVDPHLLLCDEPTGNLDSANTEVVLETIESLRVDGVTVVMITHDEAVAARADRLLHMRDGVLA